MRYPAAINDVERAFRYFYEHADTMGINSSRIAVAGDSAGGNLAAALTLRLRNRAVQPNGRIDSNEPSAKLQILLYPTLQVSC
jgi:acetyl esterase/lipase